MLQVVTADHLQVANFEQHIENAEVMDCSEYDTALRSAGDEADRANNGDSARALRLVAAICSMHFRPNDATEPFAPLVVWADGSRSMGGSDLNQDQIDAFKQICSDIQNLPIRTRIADIIWTNDKQAAAFGRVAIDGYVAMIQRLLDGTGTERFHEANPSGVTTEEYIERACIIARRTGWTKTENDKLRAATLACYSHALNEGDGYAKTRFGRLVQRLRLVDADELLSQLSPHVAPLLNSKEFPQAEALQGLMVDVARNAQSADAHRNAVSTLVGVFEQKADTLRMGILKTHAIQQAIDTLHGVKGFADKRSELHQKLKDAQINVMEEMGSFSHETDISELVNATLKDFEGLDLLDSLERLAQRAYPPKPEKLIEEAREQAKNFPLSGLFSTSLLDERGRTIATAPGSSSFGEDGQEVLRHKIIQHEGIRIGLTVGATLEPVREKLSSENKITPELLAAICSVSPFVPDGTQHIFARGLHSFLHGDYLVASALLVPYLEQGLRSFVEFAGRSSTTIKPGGIETSIGLGPMLSNHRDVLESVFGPPIVFCIENMFVHELGPKVRHRHCHGLLHDGFYYSRDSVYCCWLIYALVFLPLRSGWPEIKRHISEQCGLISQAPK
jgi:hypothetical protein